MNPRVEAALNDQISKEATLGIKCFSLQQMEAIQKYFADLSVLF
jgi:hypothetical protein